MSVNPGTEFFGENLEPEPTYPIDVPTSGGAIIQSVNGATSYMLPNGQMVTLDENGNLVP